MDDTNYNYGLNYSLLETPLGSGSYGKVSVTTMDNSKKVAAKTCIYDNSKKHGIPFLIEPIIMKTIIHPYINPALNIFSENGKLYIFQELARCDMRKYTRISDKVNAKPTHHNTTVLELKKWCSQLLSALACFHKESLVHADIKAANVLLFYNGDVKLSDFTLTKKKWFEEQKFTHITGTPTHRSLECWLNLPWEKDLDIWSLGCTFYEIAYGKSLFPYQFDTELEREKDRELTMKEKYYEEGNMAMVRETLKRIKDIELKIKELNKKKAVNCILDWGEKFSLPLTIEIKKFNFSNENTFNYKEFINFEANSKGSDSIDLINNYDKIKEKIYPRYDVPYETFKLPDKFFNKEMQEFNDMIICMLQIDSNNRPNIEKLLKHNFVASCNVPVNVTILRPFKQDIERKELARLMGRIQSSTDEPCENYSIHYPILLEKVRELAKNIYASCSHMISIPDALKAVTASWISNKIVFGHPPNVLCQEGKNSKDIPPYNVYEIIETEQKICNELKFRLHLI